MQGTSETFFLCLLVSVTCEPMSKVFILDRSSRDMAGDLALLVRTLDPSLQSHPVHSLSLWKPIPFLNLTDANFQDNVKALHLDPTKENDKAKFLEHYLSITECFGVTPLPPKHLHLIIQLPPLTESPRKRSRKEDDDQTPSYFTSPAVQGAPSSIAECSNVRKLQENPVTRFANDRSYNDTQFPPVALLYHGFGRFLDCANEDRWTLCLAATNVDLRSASTTLRTQCASIIRMRERGGTKH
ncbi:hypothetical protein BJV78DRAFT_151983 [Lactifluus subvellereus]|nr:hypothetical protein BJV78DRAFT_151983 [Lactifluus subvellereus]